MLLDYPDPWMADRSISKDNFDKSFKGKIVTKFDLHIFFIDM